MTISGAWGNAPGKRDPSVPAPRAVKQKSEPVVVKKRCAPRTWPCPVCGRKGRRERERTLRVRHLAHKRPAF